MQIRRIIIQKYNRRFHFHRIIIHILKFIQKYFIIFSNITIFVSMKTMIFTSMPMFVCLFWTVIMAIELKKDRSNTRLHLLAFMAISTLLYFGHCVFFNHETSIIPLTDTIYCTANLAVYPLYFLYICSLTIRSEQNQERMGR